jgi:hypothetical protein
MVLSDVLPCASYNILCPCWFWPWYEERQTIPWLKPTRTNNVIQSTLKNVRKYHGQNQQGQTMLYKALLRCALNNIVCPCWFWPWYCLTFFDVLCITLFVLVGFGHGIVWRSSMCFVYHCYTMAKTHKDKQCNTKHIEERQTIPWPKPTGQTMLYKTHRRTSDNTMAKTHKDKQCYTKHIEERQTIPWPKPTRTNNVNCLTFFDVFCITLFVLVRFGHGIVWRSSMCFV